MAQFSRRCVVLIINDIQQNGCRQMSTKTKQIKVIGLAEKPDPTAIDKDFIGPPDKESNIRPYVRYIPANETPMAKSLREKRIEVANWNQEFWSRHNKRYYEEKDEFVRAHKIASNGNEDITADKMSVFYKQFLDKNKKLHMFYNVSWYMKNFDLLVLAGQVNVQKLWNKMRK